MQLFKQLWLGTLCASTALAQSEADHWTVDYLQPPPGVSLEVGGMDFLPDGRLVLSTRRGQVWIVENPLADDPADAKFSLFAEGLVEGLGLNVVNDELYVLQRTELSRLSDEDGDGLCDRIETLCDGWGVSGNYHEFAFGLPVDVQGNFYMSLNLAFLNPKWWHGKSPVPYRGWVLKVTPEGELLPMASGLRSPCGLGLNSAGELFATDNQGDWMAVCPIFHIEEGGFYGHPASLDWTKEYQETRTFASDTNPPTVPRKNAAAWIPYDWSRSTGNLVFDETGGRFGPFAGQMILGEVTNGLILRAQLEKVRGQYQGAVFPLREKVGAACRVEFAEDGTLFVGMTNRGWGGHTPADGLARVRFTGVTPMEMLSVHLVSDGFEVTFTEPLDPASIPSPESIGLQDYDYDYWWEYGSPERHHRPISVQSATLDSSGRVLHLKTEPLSAGKVVRCKFEGIKSSSGLPLLHTEFAYTINELVDGPLSTETVVKLVPPPPVPESEESGWLRLTWGDALDMWNSSGWELVDAELDRDDPTRFATQPGVNALCNTGSAQPSDFVSKIEHGDAHIRMSFMLPEGGHSGLLLQGRYEVQLADVSEVSAAASGAVGGQAPSRSAHLGAGAWSKLDIVFRAPRFDAAGNKTENALIESLTIDDVLLQENLELTVLSDAALGGEVPMGPLCIRSEGTSVGIGNVQVKSLQSREDDRDWMPLFDGGLEAWTIDGAPSWEYDDGSLYAEGKKSHIYSPRADYRNFELRAQVKISEGGDSGIFFRSSQAKGWPAGYEAQINSSTSDPQKCGSLTGFSPRVVHLVPPDTWFDYRISCRDEGQGTRIRLWVDGVLVNDFFDGARTYATGQIAIEQHHEGSALELRDLEILEFED